MRRWIAAICAVLLASCGGDGGSGPEDQNPDNYVGSWSLNIAAAADCWSAFDIRFAIDQGDANGASDESISIASQWWFPSNPAGRGTLTGTINWRTNEFQLQFFKSSGNSATFRGNGSGTARLEGVFDDSDVVFAPTLDPGPCIGDAVATHSSDVVEEPPPAEASIVVVTGSVSRPNPFQQFVTLQLRNDGGPGTFKIEVWGLPTIPNGSDTFMGETEAVEVSEDYEETVTYEIGTESFATYVLVFSRDQGSAQFRQTHRFDLPQP